MKNVADVLPLSPTQQGILFHVAAEPNSDLYIEQAHWTIEGDFDPALFERAWALAIERQPILRACYFAEKLDRPVQVVRERVPFPFVVHDWRGLAADDRQQRQAALISSEYRRGFELSQAPLLRVVAVRLEAARWWIVWTWHHLILDGWSVSLLLTEVLSYYQAQKRGQSPAAAAPVPFYRDYLEWLNRAEASGAEAFWRDTLRGYEPERSSRPANGGYVSRTCTLLAAETAQLRAFARANRVSLNTVVQSAWALVLSRYRQESEVVFGALVSGRSLPLAGIETMLGLFVNALPLRVEASEHEEVSSFLHRVQTKHLAARAFEHVALTQIQKWAGLTGGKRLFDSLLVFDNLPAIDQRTASAAGLSVHDFVHSTARTGYPLTLEVFPEEQLRLQLTAARSELEPTAAQRMTTHLANVLRGMTAGIARLDQLECVSAAERHQLLIEWNDTEAPLPASLVLHEHVERQIARTPDAVAVTFGAQQLTYRDLGARSDALAHVLAGRGAAPETHVAICADRSLDLVVWLLAILKTGAAYVPLDPSYPADRLALMAHSSDARLIVSERRFMPLLSVEERRVVCVDDFLHGAGGESFRGPALRGDNAAYAIFTSGSTGLPKAAENTHAAIVNRLVWMQRAYGLDGSDRVLQKTPISFDVSVWELFWPLIAGARLVMAAPGGHRDSGYLRDLIVRERITTLHFVPSMLQAFLEEPDVERCTSLRRVIASGEALTPERRRRCRERLNAGLFNLYGPTEAAVDVTAWDCAEPAAEDTVPIGRPIDNVSIRILDARCQPVPLGVAGELYIGGVAPARCYVGAADRTAERFIPDPFAAAGGARLYRTGDKARYLPNGAIEFLGRLDRQIKVHGFRIELGEIERALRRLPHITDAAVVLHDIGGRSQLAAYYLTADAHAPEAESVRAFLSTQLPDFMLPSSYTRLEEWPLSPSGKLDRRSLSPPAPSVPDAHTTRPLTAEEHVLADIWTKLLRTTPPGPFDNFFELGGDSILAMMASARARQAGINITVRDIFDRGTIAALVAHAKGEGPSAPAGPAPDEAALTPIQQWFFEQWGDDPNHFNQALALEITEARSARVREAVEYLVSIHDALSLTFAGAANQRVQRRAAATSRFVEIDLSHVAPADRLALYRRAAGQLQAGHDVAHGPVFRTALVRFGGGRPDLLLLTAHHLVVDGMSWRILYDDLHRALGHEDDPHVAAPGRTTSFVQWAAASGERGRQQAVQQQLDYWTRIADADVPALPVDLDTGANAVASARTETVVLSEETTRVLLQQLPRRFGSRIEEAIAAALARVLARWTAHPRVKLALETHGRDVSNDVIDVSRTIGWFTSLFPVVLEPGLDTPIAAALRETTAELRRVPDGGRGYGWLRYGSGEAAAALRGMREPDVLFNYLGQFESPSSPLLRYAGTETGDLRAAHLRRAFLFEITCALQNGRLTCVWEYSEHRHRPATVASLARHFQLTLEEIAAACGASASDEEVLSDPALGIPAAELASLRSTLPDIADAYPLSPIQESLLAHHLQAPESDAYFEQCTFTVDGELDRSAFRHACQLAMERHALLRTSFAWTNLTRPVQVVHRRIEFPLEEIDWRDQPESEQSQRLARFIEADRRAGFDVRVAPLSRLALIRTAHDRHVCVWSYHHLLLDAWSLALGVREILANYRSLVSGRAPQLQPARQYREYVAWLQARDPGEDEIFWTAKLQGFTAATPLPGDSVTRTAARRVAQAHAVSQLDADATSALASLARDHRVTLNSAVQGAWSLLLSRWSGRDDVCYGATVSCRPPTLSGSDEMIGVFINTVPVRTTVDQSQTVAGWLGATHRELSQVLAHAVLPLAAIQPRSGVPYGEPMFESVLVFQNHPREPMEAMAGLHVSGVGRLDRSAWPLMLVVEPGKELRLELIYDAVRFSRTLILRLLEQLAALLRTMASAPAARVSELTALGRAEAHQLLVEWNDTFRPVPADVCYHDLFEAQCARTPDALAVVSGAQRLTYGELNRRANQIARALREAGVVVESRVGVCLARSTDLVVARLAVLKAGAAYVPLDPALPSQRLQFMIADSGATIVVTEEPLRGQLGAVGCPLFCLEAEAIGRQSDENLRIAMSPANLAYVIYTSGSTGQPKGVATAHAGFVNLVQWHNTAYRITSADRKSQLSGLGFDASVWELWPYLAVGASVHIPDDATRADWPALLDWLRANQITVAFLPTPLAEAVIEAPWPSDIRLRALLTGGDRLHAWPRQRLTFEVVNKYGPTEVTAVTTWAPFAPETDSARDVPPIGRPIDNLQVYVLNHSLQPVPAGAIGELCIGGVGLARGYFGRPDLTADRFVPNPFGADPGSRLYRTGDLVRWTRRGELDFLGRVDAQIKIRGYRVEPGEIEVALKADDNIRGAVVSARGDSSGAVSLVAYLVLADGERFTADQTRARLRKTLPPFMVPAHFVVLDAFPLNANGKVDQRALPDPARLLEPVTASTYVAPATPLEHEIAGIWSRVLRVDRVGIHDNFFALGGDSILTIRVTTSAQQRGISMSPALLFEFPTIAELAPHLEFDRVADAREADATLSEAAFAGAELSARDLDVLARELGKRR